MSKGYQVGRNPDWPATLQIDCIYGPDADGVVVLNKPPGMDTFNTHYHKSGYPQMCDMMRPHFPEGAHCHRIDRTTSGCHVWAGTYPARSYIISNWKEGTKTYLAVLDEEPKWKEIILRMDVTNPGGATKEQSTKECTTTLTNLGEGLVQCELTRGGRNHQIRRALAAVGLPIVGDRLYNKDAVGHRVMLHAWKWKFRDVEAQAKLPHDMTDWEPSGYNEAQWSVEVPALTEREMERLGEFRHEHPEGGTMGWPLAPDPN